MVDFGNADGGSGGRYLFSFTVIHPESRWSAKGLLGGYIALNLEVLGAPSLALEKPKEDFNRTSGRNDIRIRSPRLAASGQWKNLGKGSRQIRSVTLG